MIDYQSWSNMYDKTRGCDIMIVTKIIEYISLLKNGKILDFGCGTGNYLEALSNLTDNQFYGIDASSDMIEIARKKKIKAHFNISTHKSLPFPDEFFDFIYIIDVLQHIPGHELKQLICEISRVLKPGGKILILTVSHQQLANRTWNSYFPSAAKIQITRFPSIDLIHELGKSQNLLLDYTLSLEEVRYEEIPELFINHVCNKAYSIFHLLDEVEYQKGREQIILDYQKKKNWQYNHGETIMVLHKKINKNS